MGPVPRFAPGFVRISGSSISSDRLILILIGIGVAMVINLLVRPVGLLGSIR
jgi:uncharacterized membrane protein YgaE (UPF0421/DUF939 family)